jgi:hypothetical protein
VREEIPDPHAGKIKELDGERLGEKIWLDEGVRGKVTRDVFQAELHKFQ